MNLRIAVYADWDGLPDPMRLGFVHAIPAAGRELFSFEFDPHALTHPAFANVHLDPLIGWFEGRQYPLPGHPTFGVLADASPDRWGRMLMRRRHQRLTTAATGSPPGPLRESDCLLGVHDLFRSGALRFRRDDAGEFLDSGTVLAAPPFVRLRQLEAACAAIESDEDSDKAGDTLEDDWLRMLIAPGGSLGGARPKASVKDAEGWLWIVKFPSVRDTHDVGAWEQVVHALARTCDIRVSSSWIRRFASKQHTFGIKRFDRAASGRRLHFASAMTLTGHQDGEDASCGASYLDLVEVLIRHGSHPTEDLRELWLRIVFNMCVSNADDHLRNHGFLLIPGKGWRLSPAYDMNPDPGATALTLLVSRSDNTLDLELARFVAPHFRITHRDAGTLIDQIRDRVKQWRTIAGALCISAKEQERMASAFRLAMS